MLDLYICEDNQNQLNTIQRYVENAVLIDEMDMRLVLSSRDPHALLDEIGKGENVGAYFLDIDLKSDMDGLTLAQEIRRLDPRGFIIFITSHSEMSLLTFRYKVEALDFIVKDDVSDLQARICEYLHNISEKYSSGKNRTVKRLGISVGSHLSYVELDRIYYLETTDNIHRLRLHAVNREIEFPAQLKEVQEQLDERFFRCHRSCVVNLDMITDIDYKDGIIFLRGGFKCPLAARTKRVLKQRMEKRAAVSSQT
ncbi:MAG: LytTR family DNA-binding domain-containing protein [Lachnospiraceae bacterium]|nr:LytTR family DNA-binding domain-containing protein [Lachnospiraceae bacterium]